MLILCKLLILEEQLDKMEEQEIFKRLEGILKSWDKKYGFPSIFEGKQINPNTSFVRDLRMNSLGRFEFIYDVEERLNVSIPDEKANRVDTLKEIADYLVESKQAFY